ncbi:BLOC-1-related complex subunit 6 [Nycticebus coucang]|uniref:BLOC-1-related complex subunit 6 n=1 Tax=Nycticebus coucang TaxID=9470 RepID=UPI00234E2FFD|nr:BLOC-1-related complex subunit 6 [Nycticebus coucang]
MGQYAELSPPLATGLDLTCVRLFNNSSSSGTSWWPGPIKVFFLSLSLSACCQSARLYQRPLKVPPLPPEYPRSNSWVLAPTCSMESSRGRPRPEVNLLAPAEQQAAIFGSGPGRTPSEPPSGLQVSREEEAENVGGASRHPRASSKTSSCSVVHRQEQNSREDKPGPQGTRSGAGSRRGAPSAEHNPPLYSRHKDPEPPGNKPASERVCRLGSPGSGGMNVEQKQEEEDNDEEAGRGGRSFSSRLQDSRSLDGLSGACGGAGSAGNAESGAGGGRRATISSPLELEGTVSRHGDLTHFVANNLQLKIRLSGVPPSLPPAPVRPSPTPALTPTPTSTPVIPPIDPDVLRDLERLSRELGGRVDRLLRGLGGAVQELTALSVGCIQTYRDAVDSLGEAVDMSIKGMYTLLARCEELERALQPVQGLARQIRDIRRTLEVLEALCK